MSHADLGVAGRRPGLAEGKEERDDEHEHAECCTRERGQLRARVPRRARRGKFQVAHGREDERQRGRGDAACDLEHHTEVTSDKRDWYYCEMKSG